MSPVYFAEPVTLSTPSTRWTDVPIIFKFPVFIDGSVTFFPSKTCFQVSQTQSALQQNPDDPQTHRYDPVKAKQVLFSAPLECQNPPSLKEESHFQICLWPLRDPY